MSYPYRFIAGDMARSEEMNANLDYLLDLIGQNSTPGSIAGQGQFVLGPRQTGLISARSDTGPDSSAFIQVGWNTAYALVASVWKYTRVVNNQPATVTRVGKKGFSVLSTKETSGDLTTQLVQRFNVGPTYAYLQDSHHIQNVDAVATTIQEYRLTDVFLNNPIKIYDGPVGGGTTTMNAYTLGVPNHAKGVMIYAHLTPSSASGAGMHFYQKRATAVVDLDRARGFVVHGYSGNTASGRVGGQGKVPLATNGEFVVERTQAFALAKVYIMGYLT